MWHLVFELKPPTLCRVYAARRTPEWNSRLVMDHDVARSIYKHDPDGNMVEITPTWRRTGALCATASSPREANGARRYSAAH
jgi:hypothetical protein